MTILCLPAGCAAAQIPCRFARNCVFISVFSDVLKCLWCDRGKARIFLTVYLMKCQFMQSIGLKLHGHHVLFTDTLSQVVCVKAGLELPSNSEVVSFWYFIG